MGIRIRIGSPKVGTADPHVESRSRMGNMVNKKRKKEDFYVLKSGSSLFRAMGVNFPYYQK
jgi:hypothetical protein